MNEHVPHGNVTGYRHLISPLNLPDPDDCHVLAVAIACRAAYILTADRQGFPKSTLARYGIAPIRLDTFLCGLFNSNPALILDEVKTARQNLTRSQPGPTSFIQMLSRSRILNTFCALLHVNEAHI